MAIKATAKWLTASLHYNEPWEEFLVKAVKTYSDVVIQTGVAERFFWQRCWERGPHIKLWFKGNPFIFDSMLKPNLKEHFQHYFESRPSFTLEPKYPDGFPESFKWLSNNSVHFEDYLPDLDRLGGWLEMSICEKQYQASSQLALSFFKEKAGRISHDSLVSTLIKYHLSLCNAVGMSLTETQVFFEWLYETWQENFDNPAKETKGKPATTHAVTNSFHRIFDLQKKDIVPYHSALWELFKNYRRINEPALVDWFHVNANAGMELSLALDAGKLEENPIIPLGKRPSRYQAVWSYYADFVQKTNNRFGIQHKNEGYLYYLVSQSLKSVISSSFSFAPSEVATRSTFLP